MRLLVEYIARLLNFLARRLDRSTPPHLVAGRRGEMEAYLHLRRCGYRIVASNLRVAQSRGEIDLIGWDDGVLCFVEVKTRSDEGLAPPEAAVDCEKKENILAVARRYVRRLPGDRPPPCRFDVVSVLLGDGDRRPEVNLHKGVFAWDADRRREERYASWHSASLRQRP